MRLISSRMTFFYKRVFPFIWFGVLLLLMAFGLVSASRGGLASNVPFLIVPVLMAVFGYHIMKKLVFNLADEVLDAGDTLVVRSGGQEDHIALSDIKNVNYSPYMSPPQVTLSVRRPTAVRRHDHVLRTRQHAAFTQQPYHRRADRPHRCGAPEQMSADKAATALSQIVVYDLAKTEGQVGDDVGAGHDFQHRQLGERRQRVRN